MIDQPEYLRKNSDNFFKILFGVLMNYCKHRKFDSTKEDTQQPVTIDLTKEKVAMTNEAALPDTPLKEASFDICHNDGQIQLATTSTTHDQE